MFVVGVGKIMSVRKHETRKWLRKGKTRCQACPELVRVGEARINGRPVAEQISVLPFLFAGNRK